MASFVGTTVQVRLRTGASFVGTILEVDPATATLKMRRQDSGESCQVRRDELVDVTKVATPAAPTASGASNTSARGSKAKDEASRNAPKAPEEGSSAEGRKKRNQRRKNDSRVSSPAPAPAVAAPSTEPTSTAFEDEFDFTKSAQSFDKKKIWEEIRNQEAPNPNLLVNINRNTHLASESSRVPMLAPHEMVLDSSESAPAPEAPAAPAQEAPAATAGGADQAEINALRASLAEAEERLKRLQSQVALSEALTGLHIEDAGNGTFLCGIFQNPHTSAAHWRHKHAGASHPGHEGALRFHMNTPGITDADLVSLAYAGPHRDASDASVLERMPDHFQGNVNVKLENAPLFQQRLTNLFTAP
ncbi:hypothetical protein MCAP1_003583 [Malassezia caprae]|uniref:DFDF domain-containing protein n=1 Tax=Malassezia caprae TaxID=1381934 RepID=A0AAF0IXQ5_9BASI|nr:hypothetical protein MCAP1_003583 [Malassezia caprae]